MHRMTMGLVGCLACAVSAHAVTLDQLAGKGSLAVGPLLLSNFSVPTADGLGPSAIEVEGEAFLNAEGDPLLGVRFSLPVTQASNLAGPREIAYDIGFDVTVTDPSFSLDGMTHTTVGNAGGNGTIANFTVALPPGVTDVTAATPSTAERSCLAGRAVPEFPWTSDVSDLFAKVPGVHVRQQLQMVVGDGRGESDSTRLEHFEVLFWLAPRS
jgi:hypothetical protein